MDRLALLSTRRSLREIGSAILARVDRVISTACRQQSSWTSQVLHRRFGVSSYFEALLLLASNTCLYVGLLCISFSPVAVAQDGFTDPGFPTYGSFHGSNFDSVLLQNGNLHLHLPILTVPGRGQTVDTNYVYDTQQWTALWVPNPTPEYPRGGFYNIVLNHTESNEDNSSGWRLTNPFNWHLLYTASTASCVQPTQNGPVTYGYNVITGFTAIDPEGTSHPISLRLITPSTPCSIGSSTESGPASDGSGIWVTAQGDGGTFPSATTITLKDGTRADVSEDANGNLFGGFSGSPVQIANVGGMTYTSPLGHTQVGPANTTWTVQDSNGNEQVYLLNYTLVDYSTNFCSLVRTIPGQTCVDHQGDELEPSMLTLPNGQKYEFNWVNNSALEMQSIGLPSGGSIAYTYTPLTGGTAQIAQTPQSLAVHMGVNSRTVNHDGSSATWTYTGGAIVDPLGNSELHYFNQLFTPQGLGSSYFVETQVQYLSGNGSGATPLRTENMTYAFDVDPTSSKPVNPRVIQKTATLNDSAQTSKPVNQLQTDFESFTYNYNAIATGGEVQVTGGRSNPTEHREYDWGSGAPGPLLRRTDYTYLHNVNSVYLNLNIVDRPTSIITYAGSGTTPAAQTSNEYDVYNHTGLPAMQASGAVQHDSARSTSYTTRGNLTAVSKWRNTDGAWLTTTSQYDDAGNVIATLDPLGNETTFDYTDSWNNGACAPSGEAKAYATKTTNALKQITTKTYNSCTGTLASTTDPNLQTTPITYDLMGRVALVSYPDGGSASSCYTDVGGATCTQSGPPYQLVTTTAIASASSLNKTQTIVYDGLGRLSQTQLNSDTPSTTYTLTEYDALGRKSQVYNPTRCSGITTNCGETTWGYTTYQYDPLDRLTSVTEQDGSVAQTLYDRACSATRNALGTTVIDEAGNKRSSCTDGLGRLVEVDEPGTAVSGTPATGSVGISGSEQGPVQAPGCPVGNSCPVYDSGAVTVSVNGATIGGAGFSSASDTASSIAAVLAESINNNPSSPVTASANGDTVALTTIATGSATDYPLSVSMSHNTQFFPNPSFTIGASGSTLTGGSGVSNEPTFVTLYNYDVLDNLLCVEQHGSAISGTGCSAAPSSDAGSPYRVRRFSYDSLSHLLTSENPETNGLAGQISYGYDADGNLVSKKALSPNQSTTASPTTSVTTTYTYDPLNRLKTRSYTDGYSGSPSTPPVQYAYDGNVLAGCAKTPPSLTDPYPIGRRTSMCDGSGTVPGSGSTSWSHDQVGRVKIDKRFIGSVAAKSVSYVYNLDGSTYSVATPDGRTVVYAPSGAGRPLSALDGSGDNFVKSATYAPPGELQSLIDGGVIYRAFSYNSRLQPLQIFYGTNTPPVLTGSTCPSTVGNIMHKVYAFNSGSSDNGNVLSIANCLNTSRSQSFTYDPLNRITSGQSSGPQWGETYTIDAWGNLTNIAGISGKTYAETLNAYPATPANQLPVPSYGYDTAGNMTKNTPTAYIYDAENRLVWTSGIMGDTYERYIYDGDGNRVEKCVAGTASTACPTSGTSGTLYWMGTGSAALDESDLSGNMLEQYVFFNGTRVARRDVPTDAIHFYFSDHLGTHAVVENATGTAFEQDIDYYPFGGVEEDYSTTQVPQHYKFTGKERDSESGLDMFGARYYGSSLGRFMTPDWAAEPEPVPYANLKDPQTLNLYGYVRNNPLSKTDPDGHCDVDGEHHNWVWCAAHAIGAVQTQKEQVATARWYESEYYKQTHTPAQNQPHLTDEQVVNAYRNGAFAIHSVWDNVYDAMGLFGTSYAVYRGGSGVAARNIDVKVDSQTGLVQPGRGVSVNADPAAVEKFGGAYKVESVPEELEIIQRGGNPNHYEIAPRQPMTMERYQELLNQVKLVPAK
jgi:RHS repeat-associated protein